MSVAEMSGLQTEWDWVKGQKDFGAFNYTPSQKFTDWVASNTGLASGTLNGKALGSSIAKACANGDTSCLTGIGQQQNPALTEDEKKARAEYFGNWSSEYQRTANLAATMGLRREAFAYEIAAGVTGLLEQAYQPSFGKVLIEPSLDKIADEFAKRSGIPIIFVQEVVDKQIKPLFKNLIETIDTAVGLK